MGDDPFQQDLGPVGRPDLGRGGRQRPTLQAVDQRTPLERPVDDHGDALVPGQRQQPGLGLAVGEVVGQLHEIDGLRLHDGCKLIMAPPVGGGDADMAHAAVGFPLRQRFQMAFPAEQIMDLQQIEGAHPPQPFRFRHLADAMVLARRPYLGRGKQGIGLSQGGQAVADHRFRRSVHGRGIDHAAAHLEERGEDLRALGAGRRVVAHIEGQPTAHADDGNGRAGPGDGLGDRGGGGGNAAGQGGGQARQGGTFQETSARQHGAYCSTSPVNSPRIRSRRRRMASKESFSMSASRRVRLRGWTKLVTGRSAWKSLICWRSKRWEICR